MNYRKLGNSGLFVSEICFGVMTFTGKNGWTHVGRTDQKDADKLVNIALDKGINFFDTADFYSEGKSEEILGKALGKKRKNAVITTKFGFRMKEGPNGEGNSRKRIIEACEASLKRLNTDYIDLYLIHSYDFITPLEETLSTLDTLIKEGKVRYIGCSNFYAWQIMKAMALCEKHNWEKFISLQAYYSLLGRELEYEIIPVCEDQGLGVTVWSPLHGGLLTGKYRDSQKWPKGTRIKKPGEHFPIDENKMNNVFNVMEKIAAASKISFTQIALNYLLRKKGVASVVIGARNAKQLIENINAASFELDEDDFKLLNDASEPNKIYPQWYFEYFRKNQIEKEQHI